MEGLSGAPITIIRRTNLSLVITMEQKNTEKEIAAIIARTLKKRDEVVVKGLGSFSVYHQKQKHRQENDGRILMDPPSDIITFMAEK